jgi:hypothetical protein
MKHDPITAAGWSFDGRDASSMFFVSNDTPPLRVEWIWDDRNKRTYLKGAPANAPKVCALAEAIAEMLREFVAQKLREDSQPVAARERGSSC